MFSFDDWVVVDSIRAVNLVTGKQLVPMDLLISVNNQHYAVALRRQHIFCMSSTKASIYLLVYVVTCSRNDIR